MATLSSLAIRRDEANARISKAVEAIAANLGADVLTDAQTEHRDPQIDAILKLEATADTLEGLAITSGAVTVKDAKTSDNVARVVTPIPADAVGNVTVEKQLEAEEVKGKKK